MTRSLEDPTFAGHVESVETDLAYRVEFEGKSTKRYHVHVFEYPELERTDAKLVFPHYTSLEPKTVEDIRHVTAVEGTELTLLCRLNKDVATARLVDAEGQAIELKPVERWQACLSSDAHALRPQAVSQSSWSTAKGEPTSWRPRSSPT